MAGSGSNQNPDLERISASHSSSDSASVRRPWRILIVEDSRADVFLIRAALSQAKLDADIQVAEDGEEAIRFFEQAEGDPSALCPDLVLLDINLPKYKGGDILRYLRSSDRCSDALVLVVTSSDSLRDRQEMADLGINGYFCKPSDLEEFMKLGLLVRDLLGLKEVPPAAES